MLWLMLSIIETFQHSVLNDGVWQTQQTPALPRSSSQEAQVTLL